MNIQRGSWDGTEASDRAIEEMVLAANALHGGGETEQADGWLRPLNTGTGFRYSYNREIGDGGWEFHNLTDALSMVVVDFKAAQSISRMHHLGDHLVFSAVLEGRIATSTQEAPHEELAQGFCTVFGLTTDASVRTIYEPGRALRWVSVFLRRDKLHDLCGLDADALPSMFRDYVVHGTPMGLRSIPLTGAASMAATQIFECSYSGELRRLYLIAKAIEIICPILRWFSEGRSSDNRLTFSERDFDKIRLARDIIEQNLDDPLSIPELARVVGLGRQKLQLGFRLMFNGSVGKVYKQIRLARAISLVSETTMPLIEIALDCGYEHPGSFTRAFKLAFGECPNRVRANLLQKRALEKAIAGHEA